MAAYGIIGLVHGGMQADVVLEKELLQGDMQ